MEAKRLNILLICYACEPGKGSEAGRGWNLPVYMVCEGAQVTVLTRENNRGEIDKKLKEHPVEHLDFIYFDLPYWMRFWKRKEKGAQLYYYLWQLALVFFLKKVTRQRTFDSCQHLTFARYASPSGGFGAGIPFVWGPIGGAELVPSSFSRTFSLRGRLYEAFRRYGQAAVYWDPFLRYTARSASVVIATTEEAKKKIAGLGAPNCLLYSNSALSEEDLLHLGEYSIPKNIDGIKFMCSGRLLAFKGFDLAIKAFALAGISGAELEILGDGPERNSLERLAKELGVEDTVRFYGSQPRSKALEILKESAVFIHASLHESGGWVCLEAMAARRPVICIHQGGPAVQVNDETGIRLRLTNPDDVVRCMASAMQKLASDPDLRETMGNAGAERVCSMFTWQRQAQFLLDIHRAITGGEKTYGQ